MATLHRKQFISGKTTWSRTTDRRDRRTRQRNRKDVAGMTRKKLLAAVLLMLALLAAVSLSSAETKKMGAYTVEFLDEDAGTVRIMGYSIPTELKDQETIELNIPGELNGYTVTEIGSEAFKNQRKLSKVHREQGVFQLQAAENSDDPRFCY